MTNYNQLGNQAASLHSFGEALARQVTDLDYSAFPNSDELEAAHQAILDAIADYQKVTAATRDRCYAIHDFWKDNGDN